MRKFFLFVACLSFLIAACGPKADLKKVAQQKDGDYTVTILSETGTMKNGQNDFSIEFRKTADNQLVDVGAVDVAPLMEMAGMSPMMGEAKVSPTDTPGRYTVKGKLSMVGLWKFKVSYGTGQTVRFNLSAQ